MSFLPFSSLFISTLILGSLIAISSTHWVTVWVGLELNLISFIPLLFLSSSNNENEAAMKYFLAQALGSSLILISGVNLICWPHSLLSSSFMNSLLLMGLLIKLGLPPCHFWFPSVMSAMSWPMCFVLSSWQKLAPLFILIYMTSFDSFILIFLLIMSASLIGGFGGISQSLLKPMLAFSSIGHMSWVVGASLTSMTLSLMYYAIYVLILFSIILSMFFLNLFSLSSISSSISLSYFIFISIFISLMSMAGVPPFLGFFPKWMIIQSLVPWSFMIPLMLILGSLLNLLYYLNFLFIFFVNQLAPKWFSTSSDQFPSWPFLMSSLTILFSPMILF